MKIEHQNTSATAPSIFDRHENQILLVVCARRLIRTIGITGIIWGLFNIGVGVVAIQVNALNAIVLGLGILMLGAGIDALRKPSLTTILIEAWVSLGLFVWNVFITIFNTLHGAEPNIRGIAAPAVIAGVFFHQYSKLHHLREMTASLPAEELKRAKLICKELRKKKPKKEPNIAESADRRFRFALTGDRIFCFRRDMQRAYYLTKEEFRGALKDPDKKSLRMTIDHPLGKLKHTFNRKTSDKIRTWLNPMPAEAIAPPPVQPGLRVKPNT